MENNKNTINDPKYWVLNPLNDRFKSIPKRRKGLIRDPVCYEEDDFRLGQLAWIPRRDSFIKKLNAINRPLSLDIKSAIKSTLMAIGRRLSSPIHNFNRHK